jgi:hypothetical protein
VAKLVGGVDVRAVVDEPLGGLGQAIYAGPDERGGAVFAGGVEVGAGVDEELSDISPARSASFDERGGTKHWDCI